MKVVMPVGALHVGGGCRVLAGLANALVAAGHEVDLVIPADAPIEYELHCHVVKVAHLAPESIPYGDIVLPNFYTTFLPAYEAWPTQCVRLCQGFEPLWVQDRDFALWTYSQGVPTLCVSYWLDDVLFEAVGQRSRVVDLGVDHRVFHPKGKKKHHTEKVILYIARDPDAGYALKGFADFKRAMHRFANHYKGKYCVYLVCPERPLSLGKRIKERVLPAQNDREMAHLYRKADVFVSTSWIEGFGLPPLEAMACGTPVVTTDSGGIRDFCVHRRSAYITQPHDYKRLAHGMYKVLSNRDFRQSITQGGVRSARHFVERRQYAKMVAALEDIHAERTAGASC